MTNLTGSSFFSHAANVIPRKGKNVHLLTKFPPLLLTPHLMLVSFKIYCLR